jgi:predicted RNA-binding protein with PIN domain
VARWLVDGMNVVGARPDGWWRDRGAAMARLAAALDAFARETGEPVTVVFDGRPRDLGAGGVDVRFASRSGPNAADDDIAALAAADADPPSLRVVTSDATLADRVGAAGAEVIGAGAFRRRLDDLTGQEGRGSGRSSRS